MVRENYNLLQSFFRETLKIKRDYGTIPGVEKPVLFKSGAEKLKVLFALAVEMDRTDQQLDVPNQFYMSTYKATVKNIDGRILAECEGSCNNSEDKYAFVYVSRPYGTQPEKEEADTLEANKQGRFKKIADRMYWQDKQQNPNRLNVVNTVQKMAQKRAFVGAILLATGASYIFTQDLKGDEEQFDDGDVDIALKELEGIETVEQLQAVVEKYTDIYDGNTEFTAEAKKIREKLKGN